VKIRNVEEWDLPGLPERLSKAAEDSGKTIAKICREVKISRSFWYKVVSGEESSIALHTLSKLEKVLGADLGLKDVCELSVLPSAALEFRSTLPDDACVYFAIDSSGLVQYVGASKNLKSRWAGHHKYKQLQEMGGVTISYLRVDESMLGDVETAMIKLLSPPLNGVPGWTKGVSRCEDPDTVRPTAIARSVYVRVVEYCALSGRPLRAVIEQAIVEFLEENDNN
jgi:transcriptional regulator with XRE-family HTH domain